jgi:hypothetical protein
MDGDLDLRLSAQRALLGAITGLRTVSAEVENNVVKWRCVFSSYIEKEQYWEELSCTAAEVIADYPDGYIIEEEYLVIPSSGRNSQKINEIEQLKNIVFARYEPSE